MIDYYYEHSSRINGDGGKCATNIETTLWNCNKDGSRSPEVCLQGAASNQPVLLT